MVPNNQWFYPSKQSIPGDSIRDLFIPKRWRSPTTFEFGSRFNHPKKVTKNWQVVKNEFLVPFMKISRLDTHCEPGCW